MFSGDLSAGLTVGVMLIPQGMAYSMLAGLPPIYGLYASTIPLIVYALMGTSRQLAVGPVAMVALLIASGVGQLAELGTTEYITLAILLALMVGLIQFSMGLFRLGFVVNFLAHPVIAGFTSAAALIIGFSQLKHLLGLDIPRGKVHETLINVFQNIDQINPYTFAIGISAIGILIAIKKWARKLPGPLLVVVFGMAAVYFLGLYEEGVKIVKNVPEGFPSLNLPSIDMSAIGTLMPIALTIAFVGFMESIAVAKAIQAKHKNYKLDANQELMALGMANILGSFFKSFPVTGGFSRTAVNDQSGAKTGMASIISAFVIILTLLFLTKYFYYLPTAVLAAIIMVAVFGLIDFKEAKHLWQVDKQDFWLFMITAIVTLAVGIEQGILAGVALSILALVYRTSYPHMAELGRIDDTDIFRNVNRFSSANALPQTLIYRIDAPLFFGNINYVKDKIESRIQNGEDINKLVLHFGSVQRVDSSAIHAILDLIEELKSSGVTIIFTDVIGPVRDIFAINKVVEKAGRENFYLSLNDMVESVFKNGNKIHEPIVFQSDK